ncbi:MAG: 6-hydroxycyclohex-1-ene-1-carboxyl-CoA dehydrogenase [bacterium]|nr:MAG: 6-hydroxycyclohex-1-ene-1-carboxyl-CoA dehydrogenase [bacterium]
MRISGYEMTGVGAPLRRSDREEPEPGPGQVLVEVVGCGVCHTDLSFLYEGVPLRHDLPLVLGHEVAGRVVAEGAGVRGMAGKAVVVPAVIPCGECSLCRKGRGDICARQVFPGNDVHGGFATHLTVPAAGLCLVPDQGLGREDLARLSVVADAVSTGYAAVVRSSVGDGGFAVVIGVGGVGAFVTQIAAARGARVLAVDVDDARLKRMRDFGATWTINSRELGARDLKRKVRDLALGEGLPQVEWTIFETSGTGPGQEAAFGLLTHGASLMVVGYHPGDVSVRLSNLMAFAAVARGVWGCSPAEFPAVLDIVLSGRVALAPFVEFHPMSQIQDVFGKLHRRELDRRPILLPDFATTG